MELTPALTETKSFLTVEMLDKISAMPPGQRRQAMQIVGQEEWNRCAEDIFYWIDPNAHIVPYVYTKDPKAMHICNICNNNTTHDFHKRAIHLLNSHGITTKSEADLRKHFKELDTIRALRPMPYFKPILEQMLKEQLIAIEKSRDMMATWLVVLFYTWDTLFHRGRQNIFQSETATKTLDLVDRAWTLYDNQPGWLKAVHKAQIGQGTNRAGLLTVPTLKNSQIIGFPQGADKIRQYHPTGIFCDEAAFNPDAGDTFMAIKPAIAGGGRYTAISSANMGWFYYVCTDQLDSI